MAISHDLLECAASLVAAALPRRAGRLAPVAVDRHVTTIRRTQVVVTGGARQASTPIVPGTGSLDHHPSG